MLGEKMSRGKRKLYTVYLGDTILIDEVSNKGGYQAMANTISNSFGGKPIGKENLRWLATTGEPYKAKVKSKEFMNELRLVLKKEV